MSAGSSLFGEIQHAKKRAFLVAYGSTGLLAKAAEIANCDRNSHYHWLKDDAYRAAFQLARQMAADTHEEEASRRALGWDEQRYSEDGTPYTIRKYSDVLLIVRLKALKPEDYKERLQHSGDPVAPLEIVHRYGGPHHPTTD